MPSLSRKCAKAWNPKKATDKDNLESTKGRRHEQESISCFRPFVLNVNIMQITVQLSSPAELQADWLIVTVFEEEPLAGRVLELDTALKGSISRLLQAGDISGKANELTPLLGVTGTAAKRVLVLGLGKRKEADRASVVTAAAAAARDLTGKPVDRIALILPESIPSFTAETLALAFGVGLAQGSHGPGLRKTKPERFAAHDYCLLAAPALPEAEVQRGAKRAAIEGHAVALAQELVNTPPCDLYPETFAQRAREVAQGAGLEYTVLDEQQLEAERMGSLLGVARGSERPPRLVILRHHRGNGRTLGLVGKGVTFDSGGLSLKTSEQMIDMKCDMAGAAAVLGAMQAIAALQIPVNVHGFMPLVENMPSGKALKLGDVLRARNGKTIEIHNTDAEGRLILADALAFAVDDKVDHLVDLATLTGACMVALGTEVAGVMGNNEEWIQRVLQASERAGEKAWPLPMFPLFGEMIKSKVADMKNTGGSRYGGAITAAKLLEEFVGTVPWTHIDIAGPAWMEHESTGRDPGGTGCFVRTLVELAYDYVG
jgi:leucyl aminopeptidase